MQLSKLKRCAAKTQVHSVGPTPQRRMIGDNKKLRIKQDSLKLNRLHLHPWRKRSRISRTTVFSTLPNLLVTTLWRTRSRKPVKILLLSILSRTHAHLNLQLSFNIKWQWICVKNISNMYLRYFMCTSKLTYYSKYCHRLYQSSHIKTKWGPIHAHWM